MFDFYRVAACVPKVFVGDTEYNTDKILEKLSEAYDYDASIIAFPELAVTGYCCQDLFFQDALMSGVNEALGRIIDSTVDRDEVIVVGCEDIYSEPQ